MTINMRQYTKTIDGKRVIKARNQIVIKKDGKQYINPPHEILIADGWEEYAQPSEEDVARRREIIRLKQQLTNNDYKIIKCMEATLCGENLPYDINALHGEREAIRKEINDLENF